TSRSRTRRRRSPSCVRARRLAGSEPSGQAVSGSSRRGSCAQAPMPETACSQWHGRSIPMRFADLDAVTLDAFGTLLELEDPVPALGVALRERGVSPDPALVAEGFSAEVAYYRLHAVEGRDPDRLAVLRRE